MKKYLKSIVYGICSALILLLLIPFITIIFLMATIVVLVAGFAGVYEKFSIKENK